MKKQLKNVTLLGVDCVDIERLILASEICQQNFDFAEVKLLTSINSDNKNIVPIKPITTIEDYSEFMISELNKYVNTDFVLLIQYDGFILNPDAWTDEFLNYDYIGAPWLVDNQSIQDFGFPKDSLGTLMVGNGGFCLRSKKFLSICEELSREGKFSKYHPEDVSLCVWNRGLLEGRGTKFAPVEIAKQFSFETDNGEHKHWTTQLGFHGLTWTDISNWTDKHPEYLIDTKKNTITRNI